MLSHDFKTSAFDMTASFYFQFMSAYHVYVVRGFDRRFVYTYQHAVAYAWRLRRTLSKANAITVNVAGQSIKFALNSKTISMQI